MARALTAIGPIAGSVIIGRFGSFPTASAAIALFYIVGLVAIWLGPETKGVPL